MKNNHRGDIPRVGDRALVIPDPHALPEMRYLENTVVLVLSDPEYSTYIDIRGEVTETCSKVDANDIWHPTNLLLRIPPDEEAKTLFAEKEDEKPVLEGQP